MEGAELAYLIVADSGPELEGGEDFLAELATDRKKAFLVFFSIVEAVAAMHEEGLLHRNLTTNALRLASDDGPIVVDGFQMSSFMAAWFRPHEGQRGSTLAPTGIARWMLAPERLAALDGEATREVESYATDVFSLGMIGARLLAGPLSEAPPSYTREGHRAWTEGQHEAVRSAGLPTLLERAIENMLSFDRANRLPNAVMALDLLASSYGAILGDLEWPPAADAPTYELLYLPESVLRLYDDGRGRSHPSRPDHAEYNELIAEDLVSAVLLWSPDGFEPWERKDTNRKVARTARIVLMGHAYAYFCAYLDAGKASEDRSRIVVKHILPADRAGELRRSPRQRAAPRVACGYLEPTARRPLRVDGTSGDWSVLAVTVEYESGRARRDPVVAAAHWLLDAQRADLRRAWYAVECAEVGIDVVRIREVEQPKPEPDDADGAFDRLWAAVVPREPMGKLFDSLAREALENQLREEALPFLLRKQRDDREPVAELRLDTVLDPYTCTFRVVRSSGQLPTSGWVMPNDRGARSQLRRQSEALMEVERRYSHLAAQMRAPVAFRIPTDAVAAPRDADPTVALVRKVHETWPLFTLQGPPGTGKTYVAAQVLRRILAEDRFARVLVAAQSHHALDNLLEGVVEQIPDVAALRIASEHTREKVSEPARRFRQLERVEDLIKSIATAAPPQEPGLRKLTKHWARRARDAEVELRADLSRRLARASSLVFSTCAQATGDNLGTSRGGGSFDWVLIEEAAHGWMTEFFIPMVHGARWLLVGDHAQLPAHRFHEYERLLKRDIDERLTPETSGIVPEPEWLGLLKHFAHLMTTSDGRPTARDRLHVQRRMHPDIAGLIATAFYGGDLESHPEATRAHGIDIGPFRGRALVWLDTSGLGSDAHELADGGLWNLCEIKLLTYYFRNRVGDVREHDAKIAPLAVLTPYRAQAKQLGHYLGYGNGVVHTVHSYQGRQAEVVLVSLVRNNSSAPEKALGFLPDPSIGNVMFSRARRLLVIAGSLEHFRRNGAGTFWDKIAGYVHADPRFVLDVAADGFRFQPRGRR
ncbi:MAG: AAA domain-containing protein [Sandaracinaceae bacterium]